MKRFKDICFGVSMVELGFVLGHQLPERFLYFAPIHWPQVVMAGIGVIFGGSLIFLSLFGAKE